MVASTTGLEPENDCAGEDQQQWETTDPSLVRESAPHQQTRNCLSVSEESTRLLIAVAVKQTSKVFNIRFVNSVT
jgi:hypothetical protein